MRHAQNTRQLQIDFVRFADYNINCFFVCIDEWKTRGGLWNSYQQSKLLKNGRSAQEGSKSFVLRTVFLERSALERPGL